MLNCFDKNCIIEHQFEVFTFSLTLVFFFVVVFFAYRSPNVFVGLSFDQASYIKPVKLPLLRPASNSYACTLHRDAHRTRPAAILDFIPQPSFQNHLDIERKMARDPYSTPTFH